MALTYSWNLLLSKHDPIGTLSFCGTLLILFSINSHFYFDLEVDCLSYLIIFSSVCSLTLHSLCAIVLSVFFLNIALLHKSCYFLQNTAKT